jgi:Cu2+-exporting ATPase
MMCTKCEAHVKKALEALPQIDQAVPSHEADEAVLELNAEVSADELRKAVEEAGYELVG